MDIDHLLLWQDEAILIINKPAGLRTIVDGYDPSLPYLFALLNERYSPLWVVHRLDKDTSGAILFARTAEAHRSLNRQFQQREILKEYHALVSGSPDWDEQEINLPLRINGDRHHRTVVDRSRGKPALTVCRVQQRFHQYSLLSISPHTGYTHQIRAHLAAIGFPLASDPLYKSLLLKDRPVGSSDLPILRPALHAYQITFMHPNQHETFMINAPYPEDFRLALNFLNSKQ